MAVVSVVLRVGGDPGSGPGEFDEDGVPEGASIQRGEHLCGLAGVADVSCMPPRISADEARSWEEAVRLTTEGRAEVTRLRGLGWPVRRIAEAVGVTERSVYRNISSSMKSSHLPLTGAEKEAIEALVSGGAPVKEACRTIGRSEKAAASMPWLPRWSPADASAHAATVRALNRVGGA